MTTSIIITIVSVSCGILIQVWRPFEKRVLLRRYLASTFLFVPAFIHSYCAGYFFQTGVYVQNFNEALTIGFAFSILACLATYVSSFREDSLHRYPEIRTRVWSYRLYVQNAASWLVYLVAYEFLFRGYLLLSLHREDPVIAYLVNSIIYVVAHLYKGSKEALLSLPFGILLCWITITTDNIWSAVLIHFTLAVSNDYFSIRANRKDTFTSSITNKNLQS